MAEATKDPLNRHVLAPAAGLISIIVALALIFPDTTERVVDSLQSNVVEQIGWLYALMIAAFVAFALWMGLGQYGNIRLGPDDSEPEFSRGAWFSMLFAAGMGVGLVFWGVAEPLDHFADPKPGVTGSPAELAQSGLAQTFIHWGVHAWAVYAVVGLGIGYAIHRKGRSVSIRWALRPLLGDRVDGRIGDIIDIAAIVGGTFGVATSLGLGVLQMGAGIENIGIADATSGVQMVIIGALTLLAVVSLVSGLSRGLKWLSNANTAIAGALLAFILIAGPTIFLLREFVESIGVYLANFIELTFNVSALEGSEGEAWQAEWSTFFWGSWISWAPLVGIFIARISRGRTVREFVAGVLLVPAFVSFFWFAVFGGTAIHRELFGEGGLVPDGGVVPEEALFGVLDFLPLTTLVSAIAIVLIGTFLITSVNSGAFVLAMLSHGGDPEPPRWNRILWAVVSGVAAAALLLSGGLVPLQTATILMAAPFSIVTIGIMLATAKAFYEERQAFLHAQSRAARKEMSDEIAEQVSVAVNSQLPRVPTTHWPIERRPNTIPRTRHQQGARRD